MVQKPKSKPKGGNWEYYNSYTIDNNLTKSISEVREIIGELRQDWKANEYHLTSKNCNHFSEALCNALCNKSIPGWVNRLARVGNMLGKSVVGDSETMKQMQNQQMVMKNAALAKDSYKGPPKPMIEYVPESKTIYLNNDYIEFNKCGALNLDDINKSNLSLLFSQDLTNASLKLIQTECDEQLLLFITFKKLIKLEAVGLALPNNNCCPKTIKLFANQNDIDFDDAMDLDATHTIKINKSMITNDETKIYWSQSFKVKLTKFRNIKSLAIFVENNFGNEISKIIKIELWGQV